MADHDRDGNFAPGNQAWLKRVEYTRIKKIGELRELARNMTPKAMKTVFDCLSEDDPRVRLNAAQIILDRGWGKAAPQDPETAENLAQAHLEALKAITAGASADVVTETERQNLKKELDALPKVAGVSMLVEGEWSEEVNDINDLDDAQVKDDLNGSEEEAKTEES